MIFTGNGSRPTESFSSCARLRGAQRRDKAGGSGSGWQSGLVSSTRSSVQNPSLVAELCRLYSAKPVAIKCALSHGQVSVDGYVMREEFDRRWSRGQLKGRYVRFVGRVARLYE
jgi:hypothetical protein